LFAATIRRHSSSMRSFLEVSRRLNAQELKEVYEPKEDLPLRRVSELIDQCEN
jgi:excinuclease ABC subunit B